MFQVRSARAYPQLPQSGPSCTPHAPPPPPRRPPASQSAPHPSYASHFSRQYASAFNQPLSLDTSGVTDMYNMFAVRSLRALPSASIVGAFQHAARRRLPSPSQSACRLSSYASFATRQWASAFNQSLSWDTSSVMIMYDIFMVRSAPARPSSSTVGPSQRAACTAAASTRPPASQPACHPPPMLPVLLRRARTGCPTRTSSSSVVLGRATPSLTAGTVRSGAIWARARRRHRRRRRCRHPRRRHPRLRPALLMRRHDRRPRRHPTPLRTRPPCGRRSKPTMPTRLPPLRRTAPSPAGASQQSQA